MDKYDKLYKQFKVSQVTRQDLVSENIVTEEEALEITDDEMEIIASKMGDAYCDNGYWIALEICSKHVLNN